MRKMSERFVLILTSLCMIYYRNNKKIGIKKIVSVSKINEEFMPLLCVLQRKERRMILFSEGFFLQVEKHEIWFRMFKIVSINTLLLQVTLFFSGGFLL